jgi:hypothetical protein
MKNGHKRFCQKYKEKIKNDIDISAEKLAPFEDIRDRISFYVSMQSYCPMTVFSFDGRMEPIFELDREDLEYLYDKCFKKLKEEMDDNIKEIKKEYEETINEIEKQ